MAYIGYLELIMKWRESGNKRGNPPPPVPAMYGHPPVVFDLRDKWTREKGDQERWGKHVETMKEKYDACLLYTSPSPRD